MTALHKNSPAVSPLGRAAVKYSLKYISAFPCDAGENATDADRVSKLLAELVGSEDRRARFVCAAALCLPDGRHFVFRGETDGVITEKPRGSGGFGYDPVFVPNGYYKTFSELSENEKNMISHRKKAFEKLKTEIENLR